MANNPAYDPIDPRYYDVKDLRAEAERIFGLCADCRLCVKLCGSFPKLFDAIDDYCTEGKYSEVDTKKLKTEDVKQVVDMFCCHPEVRRRIWLSVTVSKAHPSTKILRRSLP